MLLLIYGFVFTHAHVKLCLGFCPPLCMYVCLSVCVCRGGGGGRGNTLCSFAPPVFPELMMTAEVVLLTTVPVRLKLNPVYLSTQLAKKRPSSPTNLSCSRKVSLSRYVQPKAEHLFWNKVFSLKDRDTSSAAYTCCTIRD